MVPGNRPLVVAARAALLALVVLSAGELLAGGSPRRARCFALPHAVVEGEEGHARFSLRGRDFDVYETGALELDVYCFGATPANLSVRVDLPNGDVYETLEAVSLEAPPAARRRPRRPAPEATAKLPVAGTFITQYGLVGRWSARVCWEQASGPTCGRPLRFAFER